MTGPTAFLAAALAAACVFGLGAGVHERTSASAAAAANVFTCPMHPDVTRDGPGRCPKCKMKLVPR